MISMRNAAREQADRHQVLAPRRLPGTVRAHLRGRRRTKSGTRYVVRYRLGGRAYPITHGGSFKTEREAKERLRFVAGELAAGRNPALALRAMKTPQRVTTLSAWVE